MDKPFKTIDEMVELLEIRGVMTDGTTRRILLMEGYYPVVNGYKDLFIDHEAKSAAAGDDRFVQGTRFSDIYGLFLFDRELRLLLFRYLSIAESALKTITAYCFGERYRLEREPYLNPDVYRKEKEYTRFVRSLIEDFSKALGRDTGSPQFKRQYIEHYVNNHDEVPIWVLFNYVGFGTAFKFFEFQKESMRNAVAKTFSEINSESRPGLKRRIHEKELRVAFDHMKEFRNICAHDERLYCARVSPAKDISLAQLLTDMEIVLSGEQVQSLRMGVLGLFSDAVKTIGAFTPWGLLGDMGFQTIEDIVPPRAFRFKEDLHAP
jgi:abortive infection bacteriophage resistance protein